MTREDRAAHRRIRYKLRVIFFCLTAIPLLVGAYIHLRRETVGTVVSGILIALALILVLEGFTLFRKMVDQMEKLSSSMLEAQNGDVKEIRSRNETHELAVIADTFNETLYKLEKSASELGVKALQAATLREVGEIVSTSINIKEVAHAVLARTVKAVNAQGGYLAVKQDASPALHVAATTGIAGEFPEVIELDDAAPLIGAVVKKNSPIVIHDIHEEPELGGRNYPDIGFPRLLYLSIVATGTSIGAVVLGRDGNRPQFEQSDIQFLQTLLHQVAYSVENARLYENLQHNTRKLEGALISEKRAREHLLTSARLAAFGELSLTIAHELNNPLTGILGYTDLILDASPDSAKTRELLEKIRSQTVRASSITNNLLHFASIAPGTRVKTDLNDVVRRTLPLVRGRLYKAGIQLELKLADGLLPAMVDPTQMAQVVFSLVNNAIKAMTGKYNGNSPPADKYGGAKERVRMLRIQSGKKRNKVHLSFLDTGPGITPGDLPRIFEPFYSTQDKASQVGLGLWMSHRIVTASGGSIGVKSTPNRGSIFLVALPSPPEHR
jgi:signal transduction histidine kinase